MSVHPCSLPYSLQFSLEIPVIRAFRWTSLLRLLSIIFHQLPFDSRSLTSKTIPLKIFIYNFRLNILLSRLELSQVTANRHTFLTTLAGIVNLLIGTRLFTQLHFDFDFSVISQPKITALSLDICCCGNSLLVDW